jgi:hypothetical protein
MRVNACQQQLKVRQRIALVLSATLSATWKAAENDCLEKEELDQSVRPIARCDL